MPKEMQVEGTNSSKPQKGEAEKINKSIAKCLAVCGLPFNIAANKHFKEMIKLLNPAFVDGNHLKSPKSYKKTYLRKVHSDVVKEVKEKRKMTRGQGSRVIAVQIQPTEAHKNKVWKIYKNYIPQNDRQIYMRKGGSYYYYAWITYKGDMPPPSNYARSTRCKIRKQHWRRH